jgi:hypothetical protein
VRGQQRGGPVLRTGLRAEQCGRDDADPVSAPGKPPAGGDHDRVKGPYIEADELIACDRRLLAAAQAQGITVALPGLNGVDGTAAPWAHRALMRGLPATQRAVLILRDVLGFSAREVAKSLETTVASVNSSMQRARKTVDERLPARSRQETLRELGDTRLRELVRKYVAAWESRDNDAMVAMLVDGATFAMPPHPYWYRGREAVVAFLAGTGKPDLRHIPTRANGQPAIGWYLWDPPSERYRPASLEVLALERDRVSEITAFAGRMCAATETGSLSDLFPHFGLPTELPREGS